MIRSGTTARGVTKRLDAGRSMVTVGGESGTARISQRSSLPPTQALPIGQLEPISPRLLDQQSAAGRRRRR